MIPAARSLADASVSAASRSSGSSSDLNSVFARKMTCVPARASTLNSLPALPEAPRAALLHEGPRQAAGSSRSHDQGAPWVLGRVAFLGWASASLPGCRWAWCYWPVCLSVPCLVAERIAGGDTEGRLPSRATGHRCFGTELK